MGQSTMTVSSFSGTIQQGVVVTIAQQANSLTAGSTSTNPTFVGTTILNSNLVINADTTTSPITITNSKFVTVITNSLIGTTLYVSYGANKPLISWNTNGNIIITPATGSSVSLNGNTSIGTTTTTNTVRGTTMFTGEGTTTIGGSVTISNGYVDTPVYVSYTGVTNGILDLSLGSTFMITNLTNHIYISLTNTTGLIGTHRNITLLTQQNGVGGWFITWNTNVAVACSKFSYGVIPVNTTNSNARTVYSGTTSPSSTNVFWIMTDNFQP